MAEPGDPKPPAEPTAPPSPDPDDHVGFPTPGSLAGHPRVIERAPAPEAPISEPAVEPELPLAEPPPVREARPVLTADPEAQPAPRAAPALPPQPAPSPERTFGRTPAAAPTPPMGLYAVYALILFAVPTLGVSALIGLLAVTGRDTPADPLVRSHFIFQQRTLWAAAVIALLGAILVVVNIGVFVLFVLAIWTVFRGAWGVLRLKAGRPIDNPRHWLI
jgi:uncharacterized membrane protein